ncbi:hypothetical protein Dimus_005286, partial [Dionaea muscipula]
RARLARSGRQRPGWTRPGSQRLDRLRPGRQRAGRSRPGRQRSGRPGQAIKGRAGWPLCPGNFEKPV